MKILFLSRRFSPDIGGVEKHVYEIGKRLVKEGHQVKVVTQSQGFEKTIERIEIVRIPQKKNKKAIWKWFWQNRSLIRNADIVHAHDVYFWYFPFRFLYPFKKSFVTFHGYESYPIKNKAVIVRKLSEYLATKNIIVGEFIKKWYKTKPDAIIYGGTDLSKTQAESISKKSAVFIGRLDGQTGILDYAKTVSIIKKEIPDFEFVIVGDGEYKNKLKNYKPLGFKKNPIEYIRRYNFSFASRYLSILESLANKRLVFALYDNPVKEDYLKISPFAKFIVIESEPKELAKKVIYFLNNPKEEKKLVDGGYEWVKKQTWENVVNTYLKLWKK